MDLYDKTGNNKIESDCYIVYAYNFEGRNCLKFGKVIGVELLEPKYNSYHKRDRGIDPYAGKEIKISVIGVEDNWKHKSPKASEKGILRFPERIIVIPFSMLPMYAREILADA